MSTRPVESWEAVGARIEEARRAKGLTQEELASATGLNRTALSKIESGKRQLDSLELLHIAEALDRPLEWFVNERVPAISSWRSENAAAAADRHSVEWLLEDLAADLQLLMNLGALAPPELPDILPIHDEVSAEQSAAVARKIVGGERGPLDLLDAAEQLGLFIFVLDFAESVDGSYLALESSGVCVINGRNEPGRRRFTIAHELGHHLAQDEFTSEWEIGRTQDTRERAMDSFAAHLQLPRPSAVDHWSAFGGQENPRDAVVMLAAKYRMSWSAACTHLRNIDLLSSDDLDWILRRPPTSGDWAELGVRLIPERDAPLLPRSFSAAVVRAFKKYDLTASRAVEMLRGSVGLEDLPTPQPVPLEALRSELL